MRNERQPNETPGASCMCAWDKGYIQLHIPVFLPVIPLPNLIADAPATAPTGISTAGKLTIDDVLRKLNTISFVL